LGPAYSAALDPPWTSWTKLEGWVDVDFRNIGREEELALLTFEGSAGRGCASRYYVPAPRRAPVSQGDAHALLMKLQNVDPKAFFPVPTCQGNEVRWFTYNGRTYFDYHAAIRPFREDLFREISQVRDGRVERICRGIFTVDWQVRSLRPPS
jgi:hypothetical protein